MAVVKKFLKAIAFAVLGIYLLFKQVHLPIDFDFWLLLVRYHIIVLFVFCCIQQL